MVHKLFYLTEIGVEREIENYSHFTMITIRYFRTERDTTMSNASKSVN